MNAIDAYLRTLLRNFRTLRERSGISAQELEDRLILGPGWITRFEEGETLPSLDMLIAILHAIGSSLDMLVADLRDTPEATAIQRPIFAQQAGNNVEVCFRYASFDARYTLENATIEEFEDIIKILRDGLARLATANTDSTEAIKTDSVANTFLKAIELWPGANPSDLWWFLVYRAYCDPFNHPAQYARLDFAQSWKRTGGWALEEVLVRHYGPYLRSHGINLFIAKGEEKQTIVRKIDVEDRLEADKIDVVLTGGSENRFFGVVHVKSSFAERRTDDVPMSTALAQAGYTSPLWTMDCKSAPSVRPRNSGEIGDSEGRRSAKRRDIEDEGYFTGCFSYNRNTRPSAIDLLPERRIHVCDFRNPDDAFSQFIRERWRVFQLV